MVLTAVLSLFEALLHVTGPALRILVESFARQVYLRALMQTYSLFVDQVGICFRTETAFLRRIHCWFLLMLDRFNFLEREWSWSRPW